MITGIYWDNLHQGYAGGCIHYYMLLIEFSMGLTMPYNKLNRVYSEHAWNNGQISIWKYFKIGNKYYDWSLVIISFQWSYIVETIGSAKMKNNMQNYIR